MESAPPSVLINPILTVPVRPPAAEDVVAVSPAADVVAELSAVVVADPASSVEALSAFVAPDASSSSPHAAVARHPATATAAVKRVSVFRIWKSPSGRQLAAAGWIE